MRIDFATFCYAGDAERLHSPGQLRLQVESNAYDFNRVIVIHQKCHPYTYQPFDLEGVLNVHLYDVDEVLKRFGIDLEGQYRSDTDKVHWWKHHVVNHLRAVEVSKQNGSDYIVFADNDCWMVKQPSGNWVEHGIFLLQSYPDVFIVSPNDGEEERKTLRMSQQMFMARTNEFYEADFNQLGWDGNINIPGGPMPEYWGMLEGRMELHCRQVGKYRYVLGPEYRYWHHQTDENGNFKKEYWGL